MRRLGLRDSSRWEWSDAQASSIVSTPALPCILSFATLTPVLSFLLPAYLPTSLPLYTKCLIANSPSTVPFTFPGAMVHQPPNPSGIPHFNT